MLNIKINVSIDVKKLGAICAAMLIMFSNLVVPPTAAALTVPAAAEKPITVSLTYLKVTTTKSQARKDLASSTVKYFDAEALAFLTVYAKDWEMSEWKCLRNIWQKESHFNPKALNKSSGSYGIAQFMPTTWGNYKVEKTPEARLQIRYGLRYIEKRYGSAKDPNGACNAWAFWQKNNWY
jgi:Transglycosylase SLT domain